MRSYQPAPLGRIQLGKPLPVDIWAPDGRLLLRRGQAVHSEQHRDMLADHQASLTESDALAWEKSLQRKMRALRFEGADMAQIARAAMPCEILESDYLEGHEVEGGWLDLQEILRGLLYQGDAATNPLARLEGIEQKVQSLLQRDPDEGLFVLFQALHDLSLGYCATHALLTGVLCALTAEKLALSPDVQSLLLRAALVMNIGMARAQDEMARQPKPPTEVQRQLIELHPPMSIGILGGFGVQDPHLLALLQWHHQPEAARCPVEQLGHLQLLNLADSLVAKMAPRKTRPAILPIGAAKSLVLASTPLSPTLGPAMAAVLGFYPPGTYVQLVNGETAVVISRGRRATAAHVASIMNTSGMPLSKYIYRDTSDANFAVRKPISAQEINVKISLDKVRRLRHQYCV